MQRMALIPAGFVAFLLLMPVVTLQWVPRPWETVRTETSLSGTEGGERYAACENRIGERICPQLFLLGVQKCGSTSLFHLLTTITSREQLVVATEEVNGKVETQKEVHFFDSHYDEGSEWYLEHYRIRSNSSEVGIDATPNYFGFMAGPERMKKMVYNVNPRFIVSLRDPAARAHSWYKHVTEQFMDLPHFVDLFSHFQYKWSLIAPFAVDLLAPCVANEQDEDLARQRCSAGGIVPAGREFPDNVSSTAARTAVAMFTDGLYSYHFRAWLRSFSPSVFCVLIYENLASSLSEELKHAEPCLAEYNIRIDFSALNHLPASNVRFGSDLAEVLTPEQLRSLGEYAHKKVFTSTNIKLRSLLQSQFGRNDVPHWEDKYDENADVDDLLSLSDGRRN